jgi:hypothetical protein
MFAVLPRPMCGRPPGARRRYSMMMGADWVFFGLSPHLSAYWLRSGAIDAPKSETASRSNVGTNLGAGVTGNFSVVLTEATDRRARNALCPPSYRDPRRRCGRLFAPDGGGRRGDAPAAQGASRAARGSEDQGTQGPHGQEHRRRITGGICETRSQPTMGYRCSQSGPP